MAPYTKQGSYTGKFSGRRGPCKAWRPTQIKASKMMLLITENDAQGIYLNVTIKLGAPRAPGAVEVYYLISC